MWPLVDIQNSLSRDPPNELVQEENEEKEDSSENSVTSVTPPRSTPLEVIIIHLDEED